MVYYPSIIEVIHFKLNSLVVIVFITGIFLLSSKIFSYADEPHPLEQDKTFHSFGRKIFSALECVQKSFNFKNNKYNSLIHKITFDSK